MTSFGFSIGDIITVATLVRRTANRIRHAPETFQIFTEDLAFATQIFHNLKRNFGDYDSTIHTLSTADRLSLDVSLTGIRDGLRALEERLESYNVGTGLRSGYANYRFSGSLKELRERLIFHMQSLNLAMNSLNSPNSQHQRAQGELLLATLLEIHHAQMEQQAVDININRRNRTEIEVQNHRDMMSDYSSRYGPRPVAGSAAGGSVWGGTTVYEGTVTSGRDRIIDEWERRDIAAAAFISDASISPTLVQSTSSPEDAQRQTVSPDVLLDLGVSPPGTPTGTHFIDHPAAYSIVLASFLTSIILAIVQMAVGGRCDGCQTPM